MTSPDKLMLTATGGTDGWVYVTDVTGVVLNSAAFLYDHDSGPLSVTIYDIDVANSRLLLWSNGGALNASGYTVGNGATLSFPGGSYLNPSVPINTSGILAPYVLNGVGDTVPFTINGTLNQTAKLQSWQVAGRETSFIDKDGLLVGPVVWQTYPKDPKAGIGPLDLTRETYRDTDQYMLFMRRGVEESLSFTWSLPHGWNGGAVIPHIHVIPCADPTEIQYVYFKAAYCWAIEAGEVPVYTSWTHITPFQFAIHPGDVHKQFKVAFPVCTPPVQPPEVKALIWHFERVADEPEDTYTATKLDPGNPDANLVILGIDLHYQSYARGSVSIDGGPYDPAPINLGEPPPITVQSVSPATIPFTIEGSIGQTGKLQSWGVNGTELAYVDSTGHFFVGGVPIGGGGGVTAPYVLQGVGDTVPFTVNAIAGQSANLFSWGVNGVEKAYIDAGGGLHGSTAIDSGLSAELITNPDDRDFTGPNNWTTGGGTWVLDDVDFFAMIANTAPANPSILPVWIPTPGATYLFKLNVSVYTGTATVSVGGVSIPISSTTNISQVITASTTAPITVTPDATFTGDFYGTSVMQLTYQQAGLTLKTSSGADSFTIRPFPNGSLGIGLNTLQSNYKTGNLAIGYAALSSSTIGESNLAVGFNTLSANIDGAQNVAIGFSALKEGATGSYNTAIGYNALLRNTAHYNTAIGSSCLASNTSGSYNTAIGYRTLVVNSTGSQNLAIGWQAGNSNTTGSSNIAIGINAVLYNTSGTYNIGIGEGAVGGSTANHNIGIGFYALGSGSDSGNNIAIGDTSLRSITSGAGNIAVGTDAGRYYATSSVLSSATQSIFIGTSTRASANANTNEIVIGYNALGKGSNTVTLGNTSVTALYPPQSYISRIANGASAIGHIFNTNVTYSTLGAKLLSVQNNGSEKVYIDPIGMIHTTSYIRTTSLYPPLTSITGTIIVSGTVISGGGTTKPAVVLGNSEILSGASDLLVSVRNGGNEKLSINKDGQVTAPTGTLSTQLVTKGYVDNLSLVGPITSQTASGTTYPSMHIQHRSIAQANRNRLTPVPGLDAQTNYVLASGGATWAPILLPNGKVACLPSQGSQYLVIYDPISNTDTSKFIYSDASGGVLLPNGKIYMAPSNNYPQAVLYDYLTNTYTNATGNFPASWTGQFGTDYLGCVLLSDGRVFCVPSSQPAGKLYNPTTDTLTDTVTGFTSTGTDDYFGGVVLPDGRVFCVPFNSTSARIYDPVANTVSTPAGVYPGNNGVAGGFAGGVLLPDGRVFCVPCNSPTARIYDPITNTLITPAPTFSAGVIDSRYYLGGVLLPDGRVLCVPSDSAVASIYDPVSDTVTTIATADVSNGNMGGVLLPDGRVFCGSSAGFARIYYGAYSHQSLNFPTAFLLGNTMNKGI